MKHKKLRVITTIAALLLCAQITTVSAQTIQDRATKTFNIGYTEIAPRIDGDISDESWKNATHISDFLQREPLEYREATEKTDIYVMYNQDALYIGFYAHDSAPEGITNNVLDPGAGLRDEDKISLIIDPFNNQRGGYQFQVNPNGMRSEAIYISGSRPSFDWEGIWNAASKLTGDGWTGEMAIPFKSLSFDPSNDTWGINFTRHIQRKQEVAAWYSVNGESHPTSAGTVKGIERASQGVGLDVVPALAGNYFKDHVAGNSESDIEPSVDIFYKITPQVNLAVTINTDFSATEADTNALNLSRFRQFFEEKRAFFLNDFDSFKYGVTDLRLNGVESGNNGLAFYSRRIGLSENGQPVGIEGGVKLSGRIGDTEFGTLIMRQEENIVQNEDGDIIINPTNVVVARVSQPIFAESKIGAIFTNGNPTENQSNSLYGIDFSYRDTDFITGKSLDFVTFFQQTDAPDFDNNQNSYTAALSIDAQEGWLGGGQYFVVEENYSPGLGFNSRDDEGGAELYSINLAHKWIPENSPLFQEITSSIDLIRWNNVETGDLTDQEVEWTIFNTELQSGDEISFSISNEKEVVLEGARNPTGDLDFDIPATTYSQNRMSLGYIGPQFEDLNAELDLSYGDYFTGKSTSIHPTINWQANKHMKLSTGYDLTKYNLPDGIVYTREITADISISFNSHITLTSSIEYNNVNREVAFNNRLRWNLEPGQDLWVVFNKGLIDEDETNNFDVVDTSAAAKFVYTLRY